VDRPITASTSPIPYSNPLDSAPGSTFSPGTNTNLATSCNFGGALSFGTSSNLPMRCGPQEASPSGQTYQQPTSATYARTQAPAAGQQLAQLFGQEPAPYSNPTTYTLPVAEPPAGFERVWNDGRINLERGIRTGPQWQSPHGYTTNVTAYATQPTTQAQVDEPRVSTRTTPPAVQQPRVEAISGDRYVQVATFASRDQAQQVAQSLRAQGLPMRIGVYTQNGQELRIVLAGPFGSETQLQSALGTARSAGFSGAFTRQ
ncbi:MAG: SPOR domain-containing protein, partial [Pseudomonadota bacterium]